MNADNMYEKYESPAAGAGYGGGRPMTQKPEATPVTSAQRWLLLGALGIGIVAQGMLFSLDTETPVFVTWYIALWLTYLTVFFLLCHKQAVKAPVSWPFCIAAVFLCLMSALQGNGYSEEQLLWLNVLIIPALLMLHAKAVTMPLPPQQESRYFVLFFYGFFAQPFMYVGRLFQSIGSVFKIDGKNRVVWLGILAALPVAGIVLLLLLSADAVMHSFANRIFQNMYLGELFWRIILALAATALFYSFLYGAAWGKEQNMATRQGELWPALALRIVVGVLLVLYALFTGVQFLYLFGGYGLPEGLTYAEYAREGFSQLIWVAAINLAVFAASLCRTQEEPLLKYLLLALLAATVIILVSAFTRLFLYIQAYDLTFKRVQAFWMLSYISMVIVLCGIRLYKRKLPLLRYCMLLLVVWYAALNIPDLNTLYAIKF